MGFVVHASAQVPFSLFDFNFTGDGARAKAMGGAFISVADDGSALTWNPAGLIQVLDPQLSLEIDYFHPKSTYNLTYPNSSAHNLENPISDNKVPLQFASFSAPIRIKDHQFVAAASYTSVSTYYSDYTQRTVMDEITSPVEANDMYDCRLDMLRMGFGTSLYKNLKFGGGIDIFFGEGHRSHTLKYEYTETDQSGQIFNRYVAGIQDTTKYEGLNFIASFLWSKDKFAIGAVAKTPFWLTQKHVIHRADTTFVNGLPDTDPGTINELPKEKIQVPLDLGLGMSYQLTDDFLLSADFEYRKYGSAKLRVHYDTVLSNGDIEEHYIESDLPMDNGFQLRVGGEYKIHASFATIPIRAGFSHDTYGWLEQNDIMYSYEGTIDDPVDTLLMTSTKGDQMTGYTIGAGFGLYWELIHLDFAFEYKSRDDNSSGTDYYGDFNAINEYRGSRISMNFTGFFK